MLIKRSKIEYVKYALNFANFCEHECTYCYMQQLYKRFNKNNTARVNNNLAELIEQLKKYEDIGFDGDILMSSSHDPFMPATYYLSLNILAIFSMVPRIARNLRILTKAAIKKEHRTIVPIHAKIGMTITTLDERVRVQVEPNATSIQRRIEQLQWFKDAGYFTWISIEPALKGMDVVKLLSLIEPDEVWIGPMNHAVSEYALSIEDIVKQYEEAKELGFNIRPKDFLIKKAAKRGIEID
ncbi:MAG: radical SAM protein [Candidatus Odinarchaeota archaeon]|nr:radical SAM protein [Candidatus Odinarchaeota archaeon]